MKITNSYNFIASIVKVKSVV